jgi:hypothetical protein
MIAQVAVEAPPNGTNPHESYKEAARQILRISDERRLRNNEYLRARSVILVAHVGALIRRQALEMSVDAGQGCEFQVHRYGELLTWQLCEFLTQAGIEGESRETGAHFHQVDERHAREWFNWPLSERAPARRR